MKKQIVVIIIAITSLFLINEVNAQGSGVDKKVITVSGKKYIKDRGKDDNINIAMPGDDKPALRPEKSAGSYCETVINNNTSYVVDIYIDGEWKGTLAAYTSRQFLTQNWRAKIYGKSVGGNYSWGPSDIECDNEYKWVDPE